MKILIWFLIVAGVCFSPGTTQAAGDKVYKENYKSYSITYPEQWRLREDDDAREVRFLAKTGESLTIKVVVSYIRPDMTIDNMSTLDIAELTNGFIDELRNYMSGKVKDISVTDRGVTLVGDEKAVFIATSAEWGQDAKFQKTKHLLYFLLRQGDLYIIIASAPADSFDMLKPVFQKSVTKFKFLY